MLTEPNVNNKIMGEMNKGKFLICLGLIIAVGSFEVGEILVCLRFGNIKSSGDVVNNISYVISNFRPIDYLFVLTPVAISLLGIILVLIGVFSMVRSVCKNSTVK